MSCYCGHDKSKCTGHRCGVGSEAAVWFTQVETAEQEAPPARVPRSVTALGVLTAIVYGVSATVSVAMLLNVAARLGWLG